MAKRGLSLPHERRKAALKSQKLRSQVRIAEERERLSRINAELSSMTPKRKTPELVGASFRKVG